MDWLTPITYLTRSVRAPFWLIAYERRTGHKTQFGIARRIACLVMGHLSYMAAMWGLEGAPDSRLYFGMARESLGWIGRTGPITSS